MNDYFGALDFRLLSLGYFIICYDIKWMYYYLLTDNIINKYCLQVIKI
jgi:hypothetical protein